MLSCAAEQFNDIFVFTVWRLVSGTVVYFGIKSAMVLAIVARTVYLHESLLSTKSVLTLCLLNYDAECELSLCNLRSGSGCLALI